MRLFARFVSVSALMLALGCGGGDGGSEPASDCRNIGCVGDFSCQMNADDAYACLPTNQGGAAGEGGNEAGTAGAGGQGGSAGDGGNEAGASGSSGNEAGAAGSGGDSGNDAGAAGDGGSAGGDAVSSEITFISIPAGTFDMGSNVRATEQPIHSVTVPTFEMSLSEVTVGQYRVCVDAGVCTAPDCRFPVNPEDTEDHPVVCVTWYQAQDFAGFANARLPSEAEWEYAARSGGQDITYPWGNDEPNCNRLNFNDCVGTTTPVCSYPTGNTAQGLCDMGGNVWEWVEDDYHGTYDCAATPGAFGCQVTSGAAPADGSAWLDNPRGEYRVERGGSYLYDAFSVRAAIRSVGDPSDDYGRYGFRLARSAP